MIADIEIDQNIDGAIREGIPGDLMGMVDNHHGARTCGTDDFCRLAKRGREEHISDSSLGHELSLGDGRDANAAGSGVELAVSDFRAFVRFGVGAEFLSAFAGAIGHPGEVRFKGVQIK
jgi:hypothetical protein